MFVRILVGAPQAAGQGLLRGSRPGALFRCPITPEEYDCERVDIDGSGESGVELNAYEKQPVVLNQVCHKRLYIITSAKITPLHNVFCFL